MTDRAEYDFLVKEYDGGQPWIYIQPARSGSELAKLGGGFLGFDLPDGTIYPEAQAFADLLNKKIKNVSSTGE